MFLIVVWAQVAKLSLLGLPVLGAFEPESMTKQSREGRGANLK